jgi:hypothetical protein
MEFEVYTSRGTRRSVSGRRILASGLALSFGVVIRPHDGL